MQNNTKIIEILCERKYILVCLYIIELLKQNIMKRYEFIKKFATGSTLLLAIPAVLSSCGKDDDDPILDNTPTPGSNVEIDLDSSAFSSLKTVGGFAYQGDIIVIRSSENQYLALSRLCTHQNAVITYSHSNQNLTCPRHGSVFNTSGAVLTGPATRALRKYDTEVSGNKLIIKG
jgi:cytochrome b6-f complex iron-sulfur subunit